MAVLPQGIELSRQRAIAHVDLDCFYVQVEAQRNKALQGLPLAVVQYDPFSSLRDLDASANRLKGQDEKVGNSIIALSYEAKACGVTRTMSGIKARALCRDLRLIQVPVAHGKADLTIYREAGDKVAKILARQALCEKASIDEVYLDVTEEASRRLSLAPPGAPPQPGSMQGVHLMCPAHANGDLVRAATEWWSRSGDWCEHERLLAAGATVVWELRKQVLDELGYTTSAGVSHYKILAKLGSGLHKPAQQTVVPAAAVMDLLRDLPLAKLRGCGGLFGQEVQEKLGITTAGELAAVPLARLERLWGTEKAIWLQRLTHGVDSVDGGITPRMIPKSISCGKTFRGQNSLSSANLNAIRFWLGELGKEVEERAEEDKRTNRRIPQLLAVAFDFCLEEERDRVSRSCHLRRGCQATAIADDCLALLKKWAADKPPRWSIHGMSMQVSNFQEAPPAAASITRFFTAAPTAPPTASAEQAASPSATAAQAASPAAAAASTTRLLSTTQAASPAVAAPQAAFPAAAAAAAAAAAQAVTPAAAAARASPAATSPQAPSLAATSPQAPSLAATAAQAASPAAAATFTTRLFSTIHAASPAAAAPQAAPPSPAAAAQAAPPSTAAARTASPTPAADTSITRFNTTQAASPAAAAAQAALPADAALQAASPAAAAAAAAPATSTTCPCSRAQQPCRSSSAPSFVPFISEQASRAQKAEFPAPFGMFPHAMVPADGQHAGIGAGSGGKHADSDAGSGQHASSGAGIGQHASSGCNDTAVPGAPKLQQEQGHKPNQQVLTAGGQDQGTRHHYHHHHHHGVLAPPPQLLHPPELQQQQQQEQQQQPGLEDAQRHPRVEEGIDQQQQHSESLPSARPQQHGWKRIRGADVDCRVLAELPPDLQAEIQSSLIVQQPVSSGSAYSSGSSKRGRGRGRGRATASDGGGGRGKAPSKDLLSFFRTAQPQYAREQT